MLRQLFKNKKAQNTAEYALLIALVIAGVVAMQTYAQRALQARERDAVRFMVNQTNELGNTDQYEPYYMASHYDVNRDSENYKRQSVDTTASDSYTNSVRNGQEAMGYETNEEKTGAGKAEVGGH
jgi:Flp pilus assembly pilin Flp